MDQVATADTPVFDRRQIYRPFLERLNPIALSRPVIEQELIVAPRSDPRDPEQPPIHEAFASAAELNRGSQMALVGGIGSGKTTELLLTLNRLKRHEDAVNIFLDAAEFTNFSETNPGAMIAAIGLRLAARAQKSFGKPTEEIEAAHSKLRGLAWGKTLWKEDAPDFYDEDGPVRVDIPGLMKPRFPHIEESVAEVRGLLRTIFVPFLEHTSQVTVIVDGLDRLIEPERFRVFAEQDLRAMRGLKITIIVAAPLLLWYDKTRFLDDYFDLVKHIPAVAADPKESGFLKDCPEAPRSRRVDERQVDE